MPKRKPKAVKQESFSTSDMVRFLYEAIPELQESMSPAEAELALDDRGWTARTDYRASSELPAQTRNRIVAESRLYWHRDPLAKQAVRIWTDYAVGTGITYQAEGSDDASEAEPPADPPKKNLDNATQKQLDKFFKYRKNKALTTSRGQQKLSKKILVDGEIFFAIFTNGEVPVLRTLDCLQITDIISDPEDQQEVLCYKRQFFSGTVQKSVYYQDWAADAEDLVNLKDVETGKAIKVEENVVVYHLPFDDLAGRGNGLLSSVVDWSREHRRFMTARVALTQSLAKFAHKITAKGGQKMLDQIKGRLESSITASGTVGLPEKNPPAAPGSNWLQNQGIDITPMPRATGAGDAKTDGDQLKLMVCAGTNIMQHYFGDPSTGNLATAEAMELPMLKSFTGYQELWKDAWRDIFSIVLEEDIDEDPEVIHINLPAMLKDDLNKLGTFLMGLHQVFPEIQVPEILQMCLTALGCNNVEDIMVSIAKKRKELKVVQDELGKQLPQPTLKVSKASESEAIVALNRLAKVLETVHTDKSPVVTALESTPTLTKTKKSGKFGRDAVTGEMTFVVEEMAGVTQ